MKSRKLEVGWMDLDSKFRINFRRVDDSTILLVCGDRNDQ